MKYIKLFDNIDFNDWYDEELPNNNEIDSNDIFLRIKSFLEKQFYIEINEKDKDISLFKFDLDDLDLVELLMHLETEFDIIIDDNKIDFSNVTINYFISIIMDLLNQKL